MFFIYWIDLVMQMADNFLKFQRRRWWQSCYIWGGSLLLLLLLLLEHFLLYFILSAVSFNVKLDCVVSEDVVSFAFSLDWRSFRIWFADELSHSTGLPTLLHFCQVNSLVSKSRNLSCFVLMNEPFLQLVTSPN